MRKYWAFFRASLSDGLTYRGDIFLYTLSGLAVPLTTMLMWLSMDSSSSPMSRNDFVAYYVASTLVSLWISSWASYFIAKDIRNGRLSPLLAKPVPFLASQIGNNLSEKIYKTFFLVPGLVVLGLIFHPVFPSLDFFSLVVFVFSWILAIATYFLVDICLGLSAFWLDDSSAIIELFNMGNFVFSGRMVPLLLFPPFLQQLSAYLPFRYLLSFPLELLLGRSLPQNMLLSFSVQLAWFAVAFFLYRYLWSVGARRYSANGN